MYLKKPLLLLFSIFLAISTFAQLPSFPNNNINNSTPQTLYGFSGGLTSNGYKIRQFPDTATANIQLYLKNTPNLMIKCGETVYVRSNDATAWLAIGSGGGGTGCPDSFYISPDQYYMVRINCNGVIQDSTYLEGDGSGTGGSTCISYYVTPDNFYYVRDSCGFKKDSIYYFIPGIGSGGGTIDTINLSNRINSTLKISDTAAMLLPYRNSNTISQSTFNWSVLDSINAPLTGIDSAQIGNTYLVGTSPTGFFTGQANKIAERTNTYTWSFSTPTVGNYLLNNKTAFVSQWNGTIWLRISKAVINVGGNSYGVPVSIGTNDNNIFIIKVNNTPALTISDNNIYGAITRFNGASGSDAFINTKNGANTSLNLGTYGGYLKLTADGELRASNNTYLTLTGASTNGESVVFQKIDGTGTGNIIAAKMSNTGNLFAVNREGQGVIGGSVPNVSSIFDMQSITKGVLIPRMTKAERNAIVSPAIGLQIYQTDFTPGLRAYNGTNWMKFTETAD